MEARKEQQVKVVEADVDGLLRSCEHLHGALQRVIVKAKVAPERYSELVHTVDVMAATTVSRDYVDGLANTVRNFVLFKPIKFHFANLIVFLNLIIGD